MTILSSNSTFQPAKKVFSLRSFHGLFDRLADHFPDMTTTDWKDIIRGAFTLTPEQEMSLVALSEQDSASMQRRFETIASHIQAGGDIQGRISKQNDGTHQASVYLHAEKELTASPTMLVIVECDANCENWNWFP